MTMFSSDGAKKIKEVVVVKDKKGEINLLW